MRTIDADALISYFEEEYNTAMDDPDPVSGYVMAALRCCIDYFKTVPTVDAVEVVRCEKCLFRSQYPDENGRYKCGGIQTEDGELIMMVKPDFYCAYGEKR